MNNMICVLLPLRIISEANQRGYWSKSAGRKALHRKTARMLMHSHSPRLGDGNVTIALTRIAPRSLDGDNLQSGFKAARDGVADWLGMNDGHPSLTWIYAQRRGMPGEYAAEVIVMWGQAA